MFFQLAIHTESKINKMKNRKKHAEGGERLAVKGPSYKTSKLAHRENYQHFGVWQLRRIRFNFRSPVKFCYLSAGRAQPINNALAFFTDPQQTGHSAVMPTGLAGARRWPGDENVQTFINTKSKYQNCPFQAN